MFQSFSPQALKRFKSSLDNIGVSKKDADQLTSTLLKTRQNFNEFKTQLLRSGNITKVDEFNDLMTQRLKSTLSTDFGVFRKKGLFNLGAISLIQ